MSEGIELAVLCPRARIFAGRKTCIQTMQNLMPGCGNCFAQTFRCYWSFAVRDDRAEIRPRLFARYSNRSRCYGGLGGWRHRGQRSPAITFSNEQLSLMGSCEKAL